MNCWYLWTLFGELIHHKGGNPVTRKFEVDFRTLCIISETGNFHQLSKQERLSRQHFICILPALVSFKLGQMKNKQTNKYIVGPLQKDNVAFSLCLLQQNVRGGSAKLANWPFYLTDQRKNFIHCPWMTGRNSSEKRHEVLNREKKLTSLVKDQEGQLLCKCANVLSEVTRPLAVSISSAITFAIH